MVDFYICMVDVGKYSSPMDPVGICISRHPDFAVVFDSIVLILNIFLCIHENMRSKRIRRCFADPTNLDRP